jgi:hypothetical protein
LPKEHIIIFIALHASPHNSTRKAVDTTKTESQEPGASIIEGRELIGGIKIIVCIKDFKVDIPIGMVIKQSATSDGLIRLVTQTFKFTATIGESLFSLSSNLIDLGLCTGDVIRSGFWINNISFRMPLDIRIVSKSSCIILDASTVRIEAINSGENPIENGNGSSYYVSFSFQSSKKGFMFDEIDCFNLNSSQISSIVVRAFIDPQLVMFSIPSKSSEIQEHSSNSNPIISWDNLYVMADEITDLRPLYVSLQKKSIFETVPSYEFSFQIQNLTDELLHFQPICNLEAFVRWRVINSNSPGFVVDSPQIKNAGIVNSMPKSIMNSSLKKHFSICGSAILLPPQEKIVAIVSISNLAPLQDEKTISNFFSGKKIDINGILLLEMVGDGDILKVINLSLNFCQSKGSVQPSSIDLGKVGHINGWLESKFSFQIENQSDIALIYELDLPQYVDVLSSSISTVSGASKRCIPARAIDLIEASFKPRTHTITKTGNLMFNIRAINIFNLDNELLIDVKYFMTEFALKFERLTSGELVLPHLTHPNSSSNLPCDNWFTITNISDNDVKFEIGCHLSPDVASLVAVEILTRLNTPISAGSVILSPKASIEIKIRAIAIETSRLYSKDPRTIYLTNPDGVTLGSIWIASKDLNSNFQDNESKIMESIPLRGTIIEGLTFSLSIHNIEFQSMVISDSGSISEEDKAFNHKKQSEEIIVTNLSAVFPLEFRLAFEYPIEFSMMGDKIFDLEGVDDLLCGYIKPGSSQLVKLFLRNAGIGEISEDIKVHFHDQNSFSVRVETVSIGIKEEIAGLVATITPNTPEIVPIAITDKMFTEPDVGIFLLANDKSNEFCEDDDGILVRRLSDAVVSSTSSVYGRNTPTISLKGCKKVMDQTTGTFNSLYHLDLGQQDLSSNSLVKKLYIENTTSGKVGYRIQILTDVGRTWMVCSRYRFLTLDTRGF